MPDVTDRDFKVQIDLTGSVTHEPEFLSVEVLGRWPRHWSPEHLRREAARWAGVPVEQVAEPISIATNQNDSSGDSR